MREKSKNKGRKQEKGQKDKKGEKKRKRILLQQKTIFLIIN